MANGDPPRKLLQRGKVELVARAGAGGMAVVWKAILRGDAGFRRYVAIKQIQPRLLAPGEFVEMFVEEARVGSQLQHANIVQTYDFFQDEDGNYYLVLEWVEGLDLGRFVRANVKRAGAMCHWPTIVAVGIEALRGLQAAHERVDGAGQLAPVIHRDVTPGNILVSTSGAAKLSDFGLARAVDRKLQETHPDVIKGKLAYLAPEQCDGGPATAQSDLFSLGIVLWEALSGQYLYSGRTDVEMFLMARSARVPPMTDFRPDVPPEVVEVVERALAREVAQRYRSAEEMLQELTAIVRGLEQPMDAASVARQVLQARDRLGLPPARTVPPG